MLANRSSTIVAERGSGRMTYATKKPFAEHDLRAGNKLEREVILKYKFIFGIVHANRRRKLFPEVTCFSDKL